MGDRPTPAELVEAVLEFLSDEVLPRADDHRFKFRTLVAMNALAIAGRELAAGAGGPEEAELRALAARIRAGDAGDDVLPALKAHVQAKLRVSNPDYLARYDR